MFLYSFLFNFYSYSMSFKHAFDKGINIEEITSAEKMIEREIHDPDFDPANILDAETRKKIYTRFVRPQALDGKSLTYLLPQSSFELLFPEDEFGKGAPSPSERIDRAWNKLFSGIKSEKPQRSMAILARARLVESDILEGRGIEQAWPSISKELSNDHRGTWRDYLHFAANAKVVFAGRDLAFPPLNENFQRNTRGVLSESIKANNWRAYFSVLANLRIIAPEKHDSSKIDGNMIDMGKKQLKEEAKERKRLGDSQGEPSEYLQSLLDFYIATAERVHFTDEGNLKIIPRMKKQENEQPSMPEVKKF